MAIFDFGRTPEGVFYYAMEYLEGVNLEQLVTRHGPLPEARAVSVPLPGVQLAGRGPRRGPGAPRRQTGQHLPHHPRRPANFVKVLDFGLVKAVGGDRLNVSLPMAVTGTPLYLSPEAINEPERVAAQADVYALGALAYFLLTGTPVFNGTSVVEICMKHTQDVPERPSSRLGKPITPKLEELILRCLSKSPPARPANASAPFGGTLRLRHPGCVDLRRRGRLVEPATCDPIVGPIDPRRGNARRIQFRDVDATLVIRRDPL